MRDEDYRATDLIRSIKGEPPIGWGRVPVIGGYEALNKTTSKDAPKELSPKVGDGLICQAAAVAV